MEGKLAEGGVGAALGAPSSSTCSPARSPCTNDALHALFSVWEPGEACTQVRQRSGWFHPPLRLMGAVGSGRGWRLQITTMYVADNRKDYKAKLVELLLKSVDGARDTTYGSVSINLAPFRTPTLPLTVTLYPLNLPARHRTA